MQVAIFDDDVVLPVRVVAIQAHGVVGTDVADIGGTHPAILARKAEAPLPLLAHDLDLGRVRRNRDELVPDKQARCQHGCNADPGPDAEPPFELLVFRIIVRLSSFLVMKAEDAIGHESDHREEHHAGDPEGDADGVVDVAPVGGDRRPPPRAVDVKQHRADCDQKQDKCDNHPSSLPATQGNGDELKGGAHTVSMADFTCAIAVRLASPT